MDYYKLTIKEVIDSAPKMGNGLNVVNVKHVMGSFHFVSKSQKEVKKLFYTQRKYDNSVYTSFFTSDLKRP